MPAATMFSKFKSGTATPQNPIDSNPIIQYFEIGKQSSCAGPELIWKIHDAYKKSDGRVSVLLLIIKYLKYHKYTYIVCVVLYEALPVIQMPG